MNQSLLLSFTLPMDTLGVYISVPFCRSKCSFCNFASGVFPPGYHDRYIDRVIEDLRRSRTWMGAVGADVPAVVDSVYLGGGTPSILSPALLKKLFAVLRGEFPVTADAEVTMECAPGQLSDEVLAVMVEVGVNRVSFGVQSFVDQEAAVTGRLHNRQVALRELERVNAAGIGAVSVDLIAGLPLQTASSWRESLEVLRDTGVAHASIYMFEVDEDSRLGGEVLSGGRRYHAEAVPDDDLMADFYSEAVEELARQGLAQYEISNFSQAGAESRHNQKYWLRQPYLGLGLDAHSMLRSTGQSGAGDVRFGHTDDLETYLRGDRGPKISRLTPEEELEESWFLGLRLNAGVDAELLVAKYGNRARFDNAVAEMTADGLVERDGGRVRLTHRGRLLSNEVFERFLRSSEHRGDRREELVSVD